MGKWKRPENQFESSLEQRYWYYLFRILCVIGVISGLLNTIVNIVATNAGTAYESETHPLLYLPYSFIGGFSLGAVLTLWGLIILFGIYEIVFFGKKFFQKISGSRRKNQPIA
ncbi:hypothetical protein CEE45_08145 [Candidatus Heimdallarchaeota archaeon B3_Heim]|nr:MAG: hypothetical protein CEE45_08145 [Candidatus Heimdallarchaeota archaeon B3_Heim]